MVLKVGKYGRFYGCSTWAETKCPGSHTATLSGAPTGAPVNARVRKLRKRTAQAIERIKYGWEDDLSLNLSNFPTGSIASWGEMECIQALRALNEQVSRYDLLSLDQDFLDLLGDADPTA